MDKNYFLFLSKGSYYKAVTPQRQLFFSGCFLLYNDLTVSDG